MHIIAQFDPSKTSDPVTFECEWHSRIHVEFPDAHIIVYSSPDPVILVSGGNDEADRQRIVAEVERQRELIGF